MVGNTSIPVPQIIDGTTLPLRHLVSHYHSITLPQPSRNLTKALCATEMTPKSI